MESAGVLYGYSQSFDMKHSIIQPMKILLFGCSGQVGWELQRSLAPLGEVVAFDKSAAPRGCDIGKLAELACMLNTVQPTVIVNAAAYTAVDHAESDIDTAHMINAQAPAVMARWAAQTGALLVHYSTDYVFDGSGQQPWTESSATNPINVYGQTKLAGEQQIHASGCRYLIFRSSWVYAARGLNFAKSMLRLAQEREALNVINDQFGAPTGADLLADVTAHAIRQVQSNPNDGGLYHLAASGQTTWYDYAKYVMDQSKQVQTSPKLMLKNINPVSSAAFATAAKRPHNSRLNTDKLQRVFDLELPPWQLGVKRMLIELNPERT